MEIKYANFCKDILYEIRHNGPLEKIRTEWNELQNRCVCQNTNEMQKHGGDNNGGCQHSRSSLKDCEGFEENARLVLTSNKMAVEITQKVDKETIVNYIKSGVYNFGIDLFYGSVQQNLNVLVRLQEAALEESQNLGFTIPMSIYLKLSPRQQYTGRFAKNKSSVTLKAQSRVVITSDRKYASYSCHRIIYINAKFLIFDLQRCDIICLGENVELQVVEVGVGFVVCKVLVPGVITPRMRAKFSSKFQWAYSRVSAEELEDMTFAVGTDINVIVTYKPGCHDYCEQLRETLFEFEGGKFYLFTSLKLSNLDNVDKAKWISRAYDGFILECRKDPPSDKIICLSEGARAFMEDSYKKRKPIFLSGTWSIFMHTSDYEYAFYYPDKYVMPCNAEFLHLFEAIFSTIAPKKFTDTTFADKSLTGSTTIARSIAAASFDFQADAIIMCAISGQMAAKIAHFRTRAPIIAVTSIKSVINYMSMHHNIWMLQFDANNDKVVSHKKDTHQKLVYGVRYGILKKVIDSNSYIILVYRKLLRNGFTDKFLAIKLDDAYVDTIKNAILKK